MLGSRAKAVGIVGITKECAIRFSVASLWKADDVGIIIIRL